MNMNLIKKQIVMISYMNKEQYCILGTSWEGTQTYVLYACQTLSESGWKCMCTKIVYYAYYVVNLEIRVWSNQLDLLYVRFFSVPIFRCDMNT